MKNIPITFLIIALFLGIGCNKKEELVSTEFNGFVNISPSNTNVGALANELKTKETINGNVYIKFYGNTFLSVLKNIKTINGDLEITETSITDLDFLSSLETVTGKISITGNANFRSTKGLENLKKAKSIVFIGRNETIDLFPIQNVSVTGNLNLQYLANDSFPFFKNVVNLSDYLIIGNTNIKDLKCLSNLKTVGGSTEIRSNNNLTDLSGLNQLESVAGFFYLSSNNNIKNLSGLDNLKNVKSELYITGMELKSISNLSKLTTVESFSLLGTQCEKLDGLENLSNAKAISIYANKKLTNFCALKPLLEKPLFFDRFDISENLQNPTAAFIKANCR
jgi:protein phosphatase 1 regulatory subunit 7